MKNCVFCKPNKCIALIDKRCDHCSFATTHEQLKLSRQCAMKRLKSLPTKQLKYISDKYYNGGLV